MLRKSILTEPTKNFALIACIVIFCITIASVILIRNKYYSQVDNKSDYQLLNLNALNFPTIQLGHYALWAEEEDGKTRFLKRFNFVNGNLTSLDGSELRKLEIEDWGTPTQFTITIESEGDRDEKKGLLFMSTEVKNEATVLNFDLPETQGENSLLLATPTDGNTTINEQSGIWFTTESLGQSLSLPGIPEGFIFEARLIHMDTATSLGMGRFLKADQSDNSNSYSLTATPYYFPGEDFLTNMPGNIEAPVNIANGQYEIIISIEPNIDEIDPTGEEVFVKYISSTIPEDLNTHTSYGLDIVFNSPQMEITIND